MGFMERTAGTFHIGMILRNNNLGNTKTIILVRVTELAADVSGILAGTEDQRPLLVHDGLPNGGVTPLPLLLAANLHGPHRIVLRRLELVRHFILLSQAIALGCDSKHD